MIICPGCKNEINMLHIVQQGNIQCKNCGFDLTKKKSPTAFCPECKKEIGMLDVECEHCGFDFPSTKSGGREAKEMSNFVKMYFREHLVL